MMRVVVDDIQNEIIDTSFVLPKCFHGLLQPIGWNGRRVFVYRLGFFMLQAPDLRTRARFDWFEIGPVFSGDVFDSWFCHLQQFLRQYAKRAHPAQ